MTSPAAGSQARSCTHLHVVPAGRPASSPSSPLLRESGPGNGSEDAEQHGGGFPAQHPRSGLQSRESSSGEGPGAPALPRGAIPHILPVGEF